MRNIRGLAVFRMRKILGWWGGEPLGEGHLLGSALESERVHVAHLSVSKLLALQDDRE
jgi:hypothetical protein